MQLIASHGWSLNIADVEGAFLRGDALSPTRGRLFIDLPPGGVPGVAEGSLIEAVKTVYGLADAPKAWWNCFSAKLASLGTRASKFDPCLFYYYHNCKLGGVVSLHVDDLCLGGNKHFHEHVVKPLKDMFPFKHWKVGSGEFLGKQLKQQADGSITISQKSYAQQQKGLEISPERRREKHELITEEERQQMRGVLGSINWLVTGSRPDLGAWCSLLQQRVNSATVADLIEVNKLVCLTHDNCSAHVWIRSIPVSDVQFVMLSDAAWANAQGLCSQAGYMIDSHWSNQLPITAVIDCKPVYDHTQSSTVAVKDKRMAIEMLLVKSDMAKHQVSLRWMATKQMIVDVLTKKG
ncbi:zdhhc15, partial [Symbiodinium sp. CCMP2456]